ncbi:MAG TPA: M48 family metallopeptidase [Blastocatellia bacterium]|nr:M48 family metallopeptidase [Blastocatellia bacterium]
MRSIRGMAAISLFMIVSLAGLPIAAAQTRVKAPSNPYEVRKDVELGRQAAAEVERQLPMLRDGYVDGYVESVGRRLVAAIPAEFQHPEFRYTFDVVNTSDLNAFALPGGFTYVNRGMIQAARNEGELAGIMSHEISHVALRHGTAQAAKAQKYAVGQVAGAILGAIIGGGVGSVVSQGSQFGIGAYFLKFSREYERQADTLGAQIMANAGYDPVDLANVFRTLEQQGGGRGGPEWLSSHPNPGNRYEAIRREAQTLRVSNPIQNTQEFNRVQARLRDMPQARSMGEISRTGNRTPTPTRTGSSSRRGEPPSTSFQTFRTSDGMFQIGYPSNWQAYSQTGENVTLAPDWAIEGNEVTRGAIINYYESQNNYRGSMSADEALNEVINMLGQSNPYLREIRSERYQGNLAGRPARATYLTGRNNLGYNERIWVIARPTGPGVLFMAFIAPDNEFRQYESTFTNMVRSLSVNDRYRQ